MLTKQEHSFGPSKGVAEPISRQCMSWSPRPRLVRGKKEAWMPRKSFGQTLNHVYVGGLKDFVRAWKDPSGEVLSRDV